MPSFLVTLGATLAVVGGVGYQFLFKDIIFTSLGIGRTVQDVSEFPYTCRRIPHPQLEGCEDMWLDDEKRLLYAACAPVPGRVAWTPSMTLLNNRGRSKADHMVVLDIDNPGDDGLFGQRDLKLSGYVDSLGGKAIDLHGFDVEILDENSLRFYLINHRPPVNETLELDAAKFGANSTMEIFDVVRGKEATEMKWVRTIADEAIYTPNKVTATKDGGFLLTNDKYAKTGRRRELFPLFGGGDLTYCPPSTPAQASPPCHKASGSHILTYPNGLTRGSDGLIYVPSSFLGKIWVFKLEADKTLTKITEITSHAMPIDNLNLDKDGNLWGASFPKMLDFVAASRNPYKRNSPTAVWRIRKGAEGGYVTEKVVEDREGKVVGGATVAVHDVPTGRIFTGGQFAPYIGVCEPK